MFNRKASDEQLVESYQRIGNIWLVAKEFGMCGQSVHERMQKLGIQLQYKKWTSEDDAKLVTLYLDAKNKGELAQLADAMGRTKQFICRKARSLGLTNRYSGKPYLRVWKGMEEEEAREWFERFKQSSLGLGAWCVKERIDDLGFSSLMSVMFADEWDSVMELKSPARSAYRIGRKVEYAVRNDLKVRGYPVVLRSSLSAGIADVVAIRKGKQLLIQCKKNLACGVDEWNELFDLAQSIGAIALIAGQPNGYDVVYMRLVSRKDKSRKRQPSEIYHP